MPGPEPRGDRPALEAGEVCARAKSRAICARSATRRLAKSARTPARAAASASRCSRSSAARRAAPSRSDEGESATDGVRGDPGTAGELAPDGLAEAARESAVVTVPRGVCCTAEAARVKVDFTPARGGTPALIARLWACRWAVVAVAAALAEPKSCGPGAISRREAAAARRGTMAAAGSDAEGAACQAGTAAAFFAADTLGGPTWAQAGAGCTGAGGFAGAGRADGGVRSWVIARGGAGAGGCAEAGGATGRLGAGGWAGTGVMDGEGWRGDGGFGGGHVAAAAAARPPIEEAESVERKRLAARAAGFGGGASLQGAANGATTLLAVGAQPLLAVGAWAASGAELGGGGALRRRHPELWLRSAGGAPDDASERGCTSAASMSETPGGGWVGRIGRMEAGRVVDHVAGWALPTFWQQVGVVLPVGDAPINLVVPHQHLVEAERSVAQKKPRGAEWAVAEQVPQAVQPGVGGWPWVGGSSRGWGVMERPGAERAYAGIGRDPAWRRRLRAARDWSSQSLGGKQPWRHCAGAQRRDSHSLARCVGRPPTAAPPNVHACARTVRALNTYWVGAIRACTGGAGDDSRLHGPSRSLSRLEPPHDLEQRDVGVECFGECGERGVSKAGALLVEEVENNEGAVGGECLGQLCGAVVAATVALQVEAGERRIVGDDLREMLA
eukprot:scaffold637_cov118-Isochrysis_galbana.AAC.14